MSAIPALLGAAVTETVPAPRRLAAGLDVVDFGEAEGRAMRLFRCQPGAEIPAHELARPALLYVMDGELIQNDHRLRMGSVSALVNRTAAEQLRSERGCLFLLVHELEGR